MPEHENFDVPVEMLEKVKQPKPTPREQLPKTFKSKDKALKFMDKCGTGCQCKTTGGKSVVSKLDDE